MSQSGTPRFTMEMAHLMDGVGLVPMAMGLFGISEILLNVEKKIKQELVTTKVRGLFPTLEDWRQSLGAIFRGTGLGFFLGIRHASIFEGCHHASNFQTFEVYV
jgi:putative tricarboxylic transport membrane protein